MVRILYRTLYWTDPDWDGTVTEHSTELIQTGTEPLRNKQVFTEQLILKGAIFILIYLII